MDPKSDNRNKNVREGPQSKNQKLMFKVRIPTVQKANNVQDVDPTSKPTKNKHRCSGYGPKNYRQQATNVLNMHATNQKQANVQVIDPSLPAPEVKNMSQKAKQSEICKICT